MTQESIKTRVERVMVEISSLYSELRSLRASCPHTDHISLSAKNALDTSELEDFECLDCGYRWREFY